MTKKTPTTKTKTMRTTTPEDLCPYSSGPALDRHGLVGVDPGVSAGSCEHAGQESGEAQALCPDLRHGLGPRRAPALWGEGEDPARRREKGALGDLLQPQR